MLDGRTALNACLRTLFTAAMVGFACAAPHSPAAAQQVIMLVNGDPITAFDVEQRSRFLQLANQKVATRKEVMDELIEERLKLQLTRRFDFSGSNLDGDVDTSIANMARGTRRTRQQLIQELEKSGVMIGTLKSRLKAQMIWTQVIRGKFQASYQFNDKEILKELESRKKEDQVGYDYTLRPITFVVRPGSPETVFEMRKREAEALRLRFQNCEEGIAFARGLSGIVVRDQVIRSSADLVPQLREMLEKTEIGKLTPPEVTMQGVEVYALCAKKQSSADNSPLKREARDELYSQQFQLNAKRFLKELREQAYCTTPDGRVLPGCVAPLVASR